MGWDDIQKGSGNTDYVKFENDKPVKVHFLNDNVTTRAVHWPKVGKGKAEDCAGKGCQPCLDKNQWKPAQQRHVVDVYVFNIKAVKKLEAGNGVFLSVKDIRETYGNTLDQVDMVIVRRDQNGKVNYTVTPVPTTYKPEMIVETEEEPF